MRASQLLIATLKQTPADAEVVSHQLMLRAGLIRRLASGLYTWLPAGLRVLRTMDEYLDWVEPVGLKLAAPAMGLT